MTTTATTPSPEQLASMVLIGAFDDVLDYWESANGCVAWVEKSDRRCGRESPGYLCARHETVARRRWEKHVEREAAKREKRTDDRARNLPGWKAELEKVTAEINRLDPPRPSDYDRAAYGGQVHPSITKKRRAFMSDSRVQKMAALTRRHEQLTRKIGADK
ncbi:hypothetical protein ABDK96_01980 [Citricoccus nitrophenolicus]|uniref:Uncharacterized protein n=1 Tax=Citricoccus nitrophenolicus TaxID=863575 RepID=A0ABV0IE67_9MICC